MHQFRSLRLSFFLCLLLWGIWGDETLAQEASALESRKEALLEQYRNNDLSPDFFQRLTVLRDELVARDGVPSEDVHLMSLCLAFAYEDEEEHGKALDVYLDTLGLVPPTWEANPNLRGELYHLIGHCHDALGDFDNALTFHLMAIEHSERVEGELSKTAASQLSCLGDLYQESGQLERAEEALLRCVKIRKAVFETPNPDISEALRELADIYSEQKEFLKCEDYYRQTLESMPERPDDNYPDLLAVLQTLGVLCQLHGKYEEAERHYLRNLEISLEEYPENLDLLAQGYEKLAGLMEVSHQDARAVGFVEKRIAVLSKIPETSHEEMEGARLQLSRVLNEVGRLEESEAIVLQCLADKTARLGERHPDLSATLNHLANIYRVTDRSLEAIETYQRSIDYQLDSDDPGDITIHAARIGLGSVYLYLMQYEESEHYFESALKTVENSEDGASPFATATALMSLGIAYRENGKYEAAINQLNSAVSLMRDLYKGELHPELIQSRNELAKTHVRIGNYAEADRMLRDLLDLSKQHHGENHRSTLQILQIYALLKGQLGQLKEAEKCYQILIENQSIYPGGAGILLGNRAGLAHSEKRFSDAEKMYRQAIDLLSEEFGEMHPKTATLKNNLGILLQEVGRFEEAMELVQESYESSKKSLGTDHEDTLYAMILLAHLNKRLGRVETVSGLLNSVLQISQSSFPAGHPLRAQVLGSLATFCHATDNSKQAVSYAERYVEASGQQMDQILASFSEKDCLNYLEAQRSFSPLHVAGMIGDGPTAAKAVLRFKGVVATAISDYRSSLRQFEERSPGVALLEEHRKLSRSIRRATMLGESVEELEGERESVRREISLLAGFSSSYQNTVSVADLQNSLKDDQVVLEIFRFSGEIGYEEEKTDQYACCLIRKGRSPDFLWLGRADGIDELASAYRVELTGSADRFRNAETQLYRKLLSPVLEQVRPDDELIFCPDSQLNLIPIGFLRNSESVPVCFERSIRIVNSSRDLLQSSGSRQSPTKRALLVGGVDYNAVPERVAFTPELARDHSDGRRDGENIYGFRSGTFLEYLPWSKTEVEMLEPILANSGYSVETIIGHEATEQSITEYVSEGFDIIHLATHGFYVPRKPISSQRSTVELGKSMPASIFRVSNPLLRGGLFLVGAQRSLNPATRAKDLRFENDGILFSDELNEVDLSSTDLVVLSACSTGVGEVTDGEGIFGLRRVLYSSGANTALLTFWPVEDETTAEFMKGFYSRYVKGHSADSSLNLTRKALYHAWVAKYGDIEAIEKLAPFTCTSLGNQF
ncbi:MAG: hypothetical protein CMO55_25050 [Verrucomicrobiales bacterium]|nr:hypothetical protein [Verrucomicrobiales bacterium]